MKNQYFGDVGDYGKYGLLRFLAAHDVTIAVNWYLTPADDSNDGNLRGYLNDGRFRECDPELFDSLKDMCARNERDVYSFAMRSMIPGAIYFDDPVEPASKAAALSVREKQAARAHWHQRALAACNGAELVFTDPDNGLKSGKPSGRKDAPKYVFATEASEYYNRGQNVVYYCHRGRRTDEAWEKAKRTLLEYCTDAVLMGLTYHRGTQRSYLFAVHPEQEDRYRSLVNGFLKTRWKNHFTNEF